MRALVLAVTLVVVPTSAFAQAARVDPETGERYRLVRPPDGPARGHWSASPPVVWGSAGIIFATATLVLVRRLRLRKR